MMSKSKQGRGRKSKFSLDKSTKKYGKVCRGHAKGKRDVVVICSLPQVRSVHCRILAAIGLLRRA